MARPRCAIAAGQLHDLFLIDLCVSFQCRLMTEGICLWDVRCCKGPMSLGCDKCRTEVEAIGLCSSCEGHAIGYSRRESDSRFFGQNGIDYIIHPQLIWKAESADRQTATCDLRRFSPKPLR